MSQFQKPDDQLLKKEMKRADSLLTKQKGSSTKGELPAFDRALPISLLRAREAVISKFLPHLKEHDLSAQQWRAIRSLDQEDGVEISELSERCYLLKPSMSRIVRNLESRGIIERRSVLSDQRRNALYLTEVGRNLVNEIAPKSEERYEFIARQFGSSKLQLLQELLEDLVDSIKEEN